jgi:hypothetical protein
MLTREQLIQRWKSWMNRHRSFSKPEMEELESHLWEEMDEMVVTEGCTEEEAFHQVVAKVGSRQVLGTEYKKINKFSLPRFNSWAHDHQWIIFISLLLVIFLIISDYVYASSHFIEEIKTIQSNIVELDLIKDKQGLIIYEPYFSGFQKDNFIITDIKPILKGIFYLYPSLLYVVYDDEDNIWISSTNIFNKKTKKFKINPPKNYIEHEYTYGYLLPITNESTDKNSITTSIPDLKALKKKKTYEETSFSSGLNKFRPQISVNDSDERLSTFVLFYDDQYQIIHTQRKMMALFFMGETEMNYSIVAIKDNYAFFSDPDRSSYFLYENEKDSFLLKMELFEILPKKTNSYLTVKNGETFLVQNTTIGTKRYELHWNLLKNVKEPIHLHQAILTSIQKFFKASSDKNNQPNSFDTKGMGINADS